jgi:lambda repressor-like predicted transcriptional regulator
MVDLLASNRKSDPPLKNLQELARIGDQPKRQHAEVQFSSRARRLEPAQIAALIADYGAGMLVRDLAAKYGTHRVTVTDIVNRAGVELRFRGLTEKQVEEANQLYMSGQSLAQVGRRLGFSPTTISNALKKNGVALRPRPGRG